MKKIFFLIFLVLINEASFAGDPSTQKSYGVNVFLRNGKVLKGYIGLLNKEYEMSVFESFRVSAYKYEPPHYIKDYVWKNNYLRDWVNLWNLVFKNEFNGFDARDRNSIKETPLQLMGEIEKIKSVYIVPEEKFLKIRFKEIEKIEIAKELKKSISWKGSLDRLNGEEIRSLKYRKCKYLVELLLSGRIYYLYYFGEGNLKEFLKLIDSSLDLRAEWTPYNFNGIKLEKVFDLKKDFQKIENSNISKYEKIIFSNFLEKIFLYKGRGSYKPHECLNINGAITMVLKSAIDIENLRKNHICVLHKDLN